MASYRSYGTFQIILEVVTFQRSRPIFDPKERLLNLIDRNKVDIIFNALHGKDGEDGDDYTYEIEIPGTLDLEEDRGGARRHDCVFHLGVQVRKGEFPFQKTSYVSIVPRYTVVNESGFTLQVCQEGSPSILAEVCIFV